jgi:hypothetical protein
MEYGVPSSKSWPVPLCLSWCELVRCTECPCMNREPLPRGQVWPTSCSYYVSTSATKSLLFPYIKIHSGIVVCLNEHVSLNTSSAFVFHGRFIRLRNPTAAITQGRLGDGFSMSTACSSNFNTAPERIRLEMAQSPTTEQRLERKQ